MENPEEPTEKILSIGDFTAKNGGNHYQSTGIIPETGKKQGTIGIFDTKGKVYPSGRSMRNQPFSVFPSPHPTPLVYQQITSRKDNKEPGDIFSFGRSEILSTLHDSRE